MSRGVTCDAVRNIVSVRAEILYTSAETDNPAEGGIGVIAAPRAPTVGATAQLPLICSYPVKNTSEYVVAAFGTTLRIQTGLSGETVLTCPAGQINSLRIHEFVSQSHFFHAGQQAPTVHISELVG